MPSFDQVSKIDQQEVLNTEDYTNREWATRFDFRGVQASCKRKNKQISTTAEAKFQ